MGDSVGRASLYYPYIHIRSEHWLKATLLCAPAVKRIVPEDYTPEDLPNIVKYTKVVGQDGPLLQAVPAVSPAASNAQLRLLDKLNMHEKEIDRKYHRSQSPNPDEYWIHGAKFKTTSFAIFAITISIGSAAIQVPMGTAHGMHSTPL